MDVTIIELSIRVVHGIAIAWYWLRNIYVPCPWFNNINGFLSSASWNDEMKPNIYTNIQIYEYRYMGREKHIYKLHLQLQFCDARCGNWSCAITAGVPIHRVYRFLVPRILFYGHHQRRIDMICAEMPLNTWW